MTLAHLLGDAIGLVIICFSGHFAYRRHRSWGHVFLATVWPGPVPYWFFVALRSGYRLAFGK